MRDCLVKERGFEVIRGAGSKGADLIAGKAGKTYAIEVKATKAGPFSGFGPAKREAMRAMCLNAGWTPILVWWPTGKDKPLIIPESGWPD